VQGTVSFVVAHCSSVGVCYSFTVLCILTYLPLLLYCDVSGVSWDTMLEPVCMHCPAVSCHATYRFVSQCTEVNVTVYCSLDEHRLE
jgi:hypothetical protein